MAKHSAPHPASTQRLLAVLKEVQHGVSPNGDQNAEEKKWGGLDGSLRIHQARIQDGVYGLVREIFDERKGLPSVLTNYMHRNGPKGMLETREQAEALSVAMNTKLSNLLSRKVDGHRNSLFIRLARECFSHFDEHLKALDLPVTPEKLSGVVRSSVEEVMVGVHIDSENSDKSAPALDDENKGDTQASEEGGTVREETLLDDPEMRELLLACALAQVINPLLANLREKFFASQDPVIGAGEEMALSDFSACHRFLVIIQGSVEGKAKEFGSGKDNDLDSVLKRFTKLVREEMERMESGLRNEHLHADVLPSLCACAENIIGDASAITSALLESLNEAHIQPLSLNARNFFLPQTSAFLAQREKEECDWKWTNKDWNVFRKSFKFPASGPELMQPFAYTNRDLLNAAVIVNDEVRAGLKDSKGRPVILLSDAKKQADRLESFHTDRQLSEALIGGLQYVKDHYAECVLQNVLTCVRSTLEVQQGAFDQSKAVLVGKSDFHVSWIPDIRLTVGSALENILASATRSTPQELQIAMLEHCIENSGRTCAALVTAVAEKFGIGKENSLILPDLAVLSSIIEDPKSIYPYKGSIIFEDHVHRILLSDRPLEKDFPLHSGEREILLRSLEPVIKGGKGQAQLKTYEALLGYLQQDGRPLAQAAIQCNNAFHGGYPFRTPTGLLTQEAEEVLREYPLSHEPSKVEMSIALDIIVRTKSKDKDTVSEVHRAINDQGGVTGQRSKTFAKELVETAYAAWQKEGQGIFFPETDSKNLSLEIVEENEREAPEEVIPEVVITAPLEVQRDVQNDDSPQQGSSQVRPSAIIEPSVERAELSPIVFGYWESQRRIFREVIAQLSSAGEIDDCERRLRVLEDEAHRVYGETMKTQVLLETHATVVSKIKYDDGIKAVDEKFMEELERLGQFLTTLSAHEQALQELSQVSARCDDLYLSIEHLRSQNKRVSVFMERRLPDITGGKSPLELRFIDDGELADGEVEDKCRRVGSLQLRLQQVQAMIKEQYEFKTPDLRSRYREKCEGTLKTMGEGFKRLTRMDLQPNENACRLLPSDALERDEVGQRNVEDVTEVTINHGNGDGESADTISGSSPGVSDNGQEVDIFCKVQPHLGVDAERIFKQALKIYRSSFCGEDGLTTWHMRTLLKRIAPDLNLPKGTVKNMMQDDPLFVALESLSVVHPTVKRVRGLLGEKKTIEHVREQVQGVQLSEVDKKDLEHMFVLFLNNRQKFSFYPTAAARKFAEEHDIILSTAETAELLKERKE